ncbi:hypothetical protein A8924_1541 [Saccharopolyspora erythraea NRRL 2338]|nr:hypothetical protein A8924_1541 [Saccharopolyspora erythraea NRRL 2338]
MEGQLASAEADRNEIRIAKHRESLSDILFKSREILINLKRLFLLAADHNLSYSATRKQVSELIEAVVTKRSEFDHILLSAGMHSPKDAPPPVHKLHNIMAAISHFATGLLDDITKGEVIDREKKEELLNKIWGTATEVEADITYYLSLLAGSGESTKSVDN